MIDTTTANIKIEGFDRLMAHLSAATQKSVINSGLKSSANFLVKWIVTQRLSGRPGLRRVTGALAQSIKSGAPENNQITVGTRELPYARIHEYGGIIVPRVAKALKFKIDNRWVVTQKVTIPARPYMKPSINPDNINHIKDIFRDKIWAAIQGKGASTE